MTPYNVKSKLPFGFEHPDLAIFIKIYLIVGAIWYLGLGLLLLITYIKHKHNPQRQNFYIKHEHILAGCVLYSIPVFVVIAVIIAILLHLS